MAEFVKGDIVIIPFPFSDLSDSKKRPALVLADLNGDDIILCQITADSYSIKITNAEFDTGSLPVVSNIRPMRLFTADKNIILRKAGRLNSKIIAQVTHTIIGVLSK